jgi:hypothetical protein
MNFRAKITNHAAYIKELEALCDRLKAAGFRIQGTRLDIYRKTFATIDKFITENREQELVKRLPSPTFINDLHESQEIIEACDEFPDLTQPGLRDRIEKVLKGTRELEKETPEKGEPRNYLFELVMAGSLKRAGFGIHLDRIEDIFFEFRNSPFFIECKRIHSQARLQERIDDAAYQIGKRCDEARTSKARGIIAIDVSKLLNDGTGLFQCSTLAVFSSACRQLLTTFQAMHNSNLGSTKEKRVLGIYIYARLPGHVQKPTGTHTCRQASFIVWHSKKTKDSNLAVKFFKRIKHATIHG